MYYGLKKQHCILKLSFLDENLKLVFENKLLQSLSHVKDQLIIIKPFSHVKRPVDHHQIIFISGLATPQSATPAPTESDDAEVSFVLKTPSTLFNSYFLWKIPFTLLN